MGIIATGILSLALPLKTVSAESGEPRAIQNPFEQQRQLEENLAEYERQEHEREQEMKTLKRQMKQLRRGSLGATIAKLNPKIAVNGLFTAAGFSDDDHLNFGDHDPKENGFNVQAVELNLQGAIDPYLTAEVNINTFLEGGDTIVEFEEGFVTTQALPHNLQVMGGHFFTRFGNMNHIHAHAWDFVDQPVVLNRFLGPDGLRGPGVQASWLAPTPFYLEVIGSAQQAQGPIAVSFLSSGRVGGHDLRGRSVEAADDLVYMPRLVTAFDLDDSTTLKLGGSALLGPNSSGPDTRTNIYGADMKLKWQPPRNTFGYPFVTWESEVLFRAYEAGANDATMLPEETLEDMGLYTQVVYGFRPRWVAGLRFEYADGQDGLDQQIDDLRSERYRISPNIAWVTSEFSRLRLQYNVDFAESRGNKSLHGIFLQWSFALGEHGAHRF